MGRTSITPIVLRAGATQRVLPFRVMAPSTLGTFLRAFTFGHVRQLDAVIAETIRRAWAAGAGPGTAAMTIDLDSTICEVHGKQKHGAAYGYTKVLGYHPLLATRADTGEVLHARMRQGSSQHAGAKRFVEELIARVRRAGATGPLTLRADSGFWSNDTIAACTVSACDLSITVNQQQGVQAAIDAIPDDAWVEIDYTPDGQAQVAETPSRPGKAPRRAPHPPHRPPQKPSSGPTGATTPSSPTGSAPPSTSTPTTAATPSSSSPSAT